MHVLGFSMGYWGIIVTNSVEQFGTNIRATVVPRPLLILSGAWTIPTSLVFSSLIPHKLIASATIIGFTLIGISIISILLLKDKFENNLNYTEVFED